MPKVKEKTHHHYKRGVYYTHHHAHDEIGHKHCYRYHDDFEPYPLCHGHGHGHNKSLLAIPKQHYNNPRC